MISLAEARRTVLQDLAPLPARSLPLAEAAGCVLAEPIVAPEPVPPFANSSMDGFAVRAVDVARPPTTLAVVDSVRAGGHPAVPLGPGQAARIMTGAPLPPGADAVCKVEDTGPGPDGTVVIAVQVTTGTNVRHPGEDVAAGQLVFAAGTALSAAHVGVLASLGCDPVPVHPRPRVAVLSTGDELAVGPGPLPPGRIRDANRPALLAALAADGFVPCDLGVLADDEDAVEAALVRVAASHDAIVTSGGVSVGDRDVVRIVLQRLGGPAMHWMQVAIKPAKPLAFGRLGEAGTPVFGLPGNPVSARVSYELFVRPALRAMGGHRRLDRPVQRAVAVRPMERSPDGKLHLLRAHARTRSDGTVEVEPATAQGSHQLRAMADANALALVPDGPGVAAGTAVPVLLLDPAALPASDGSRLGAAAGFGLEPPW